MNLTVRSSNAKRNRRKAAKALLCTALVVLSGCRIPELRSADAGRVLPETYNGVTTEDNSAQVGIDDFFNDTILTTLIDEGLAGNQELKILAEEIQIANTEIIRRRGAIFPFVTLGGRAGLEKPSLFTPMGAVEENLPFRPGQFFPTPLPDFMTAASLSWQVDIWRQLRNARDAATLRYLATIDGRNYVVTRLVAEIAENYYKLMALDKRLENLDRTIGLQERSLEFAIASKEGARGTELPVQRFQAEVRKNQSEKLIIRQEIIETENRINFLLGRFPQPVMRNSENFFNIHLEMLRLGIPCELLLNRPDIRQAERELEAAGLDIKVARANFYPKLNITAGVGFEGFNPKYLVMSPESLVYNAAGELVAPLINRSAIRADYMAANASQLQACYKYQQVILNAFTEVINRISAVENYRNSLTVKEQQLAALEASVETASRLFNATRIEYLDVLFAQRDLMEARMVFIDTKREQLAAVVNTYQALGGGLVQYEYPVINYDTNEPIPPGSDGVIPPAPGNTQGMATPAPGTPAAATPAVADPAPVAVPAAVPPIPAVPPAGGDPAPAGM